MQVPSKTFPRWEHDIPTLGTSCSQYGNNRQNCYLCSPKAEKRQKTCRNENFCLYLQPYGKGSHMFDALADYFALD